MKHSVASWNAVQRGQSDIRGTLLKCRYLWGAWTLILFLVTNPSVGQPIVCIGTDGDVEEEPVQFRFQLPGGMKQRDGDDCAVVFSDDPSFEVGAVVRTWDDQERLNEEPDGACLWLMLKIFQPGAQLVEQGTFQSHGETVTYFRVVGSPRSKRSQLFEVTSARLFLGDRILLFSSGYPAEDAEKRLPEVLRFFESVEVDLDP